VPVTVNELLVVDDGTLESMATNGIVVSRLIVCGLVAVPPALVAVHATVVVPSVLTVVVVASVAH
jgi:hypothetical protein